MLFAIRYSARTFLRAPGSTAALLLSIALGIGSNISVYGFVHGLTTPAYPAALGHGLVSIFEQHSQTGAGPFTYQEYLSLKNEFKTFEWIGAARISPSTVERTGQSEIMTVAAVTPEIATAFQLSLEKGALISDRLWRNEFEAKEDVRGEQMHINGASVRISGIAPKWLEGLYRDRAVDIWMPLGENGLVEADSSSRSFWAIARLREHVSVRQAQVAMTGTEPILFPYTGMTPEMAEGMSRIATLFNIAAAMVFFMACGNVVSFLLGRAFARSQETSLRVALGASRGQLARGLFWDSVVLSVCGGMLGLLLAEWTAHIIPALLFEQDAEHLVFAPDLLSAAAAAITCVAITIACGLAPVFFASDHRPAAVLRQESAGPSKPAMRLRAGLLVIQMASCCVLVISTAMLLDGFQTALHASAGQTLGKAVLITVQAQPALGIHYLRKVEQTAQAIPGISPLAWAGRLPGNQPTWQSFRVDPGNLALRKIAMKTAQFTPALLSLFVLPPKAGRLFGFADQGCRAGVVNEQAAAELYANNTVGRSIQDSLGLPVEIIGVVAEKTRHGEQANRPTIYYNNGSQTRPAAGEPRNEYFQAPLRTPLADAELDFNVVSAGYFRAAGFTIAAGQVFADQQTAGQCRVSVINQEAADLYFHGNPIGGAVIDVQGIRSEVIGVVRSRPYGTFQRHVEPTIYLPMSQDALSRMTLIASMPEMTEPALADLRRKIEAVPGRDRAPVVVETFATHLVHTALAPLRIASTVIAVSAAIAITLSMLGLFHALHDTARQRRRELAIRIALGARRWQILYQVLREGGRLAVAGILLGSLVSFGLSRFLNRITSISGSASLWVWFAAPLVLSVAVVIASIIPARGAALINPLTIMRDQN